MDSLTRILQQVRSSTLKEKNLTQANTIQPKEICQYKCNICKDTGYIQTKHEDRQPTMTPCKCVEDEKIKRMWANSGINSDDLEKSFSNFEEWNTKSKEMKTKGALYYKNFEKIKNDRRNSIMLCGNSGSGKTHIALALANNYLKKGVRVIYMPYRDIVTSIKQNMIDEEYYKKTLSKYQMCEILLIDDLFKGKINDTDINIMFELINYRYLNHLPMIISTEFNIDRLLNFDEAIGSRLYEMCRDYLIEIDGDSKNNYRLR